MKKYVLFIQGAGTGAYKEDAKLADSLQSVLGAEYHVAYPRMPDEENPKDEVWMARISRELIRLDDSVILVGHSAGGAVLLKILLKERLLKPIAGIFLLAIPYWEAEDEPGEEYTLRAGFSSRLPQGIPVFFYHSRDDEIIPFAHLAKYAEKVPQATVRQFDRGGHQFNSGMSKIATDITGL